MCSNIMFPYNSLLAISIFSHFWQMEQIEPLEICFLVGHFSSSNIYRPSFLLIEGEEGLFFCLFELCTRDLKCSCSFQNMAYLNSVDLCTCVVNSVLDIWSRQLLKKRTSAWCLFLNFHRARIHQFRPFQAESDHLLLYLRKCILLLTKFGLVSSICCKVRMPHQDPFSIWLLIPNKR
ncbi:hypothetical protein Tsp_05030 [Trichinella spiralis]|uniref:hypothetical protein n=1 Tax=Trichinella spiralis TaxID=6334 RepID=UPI0001EFEB11|nr:hypothetical protein Tsp_05030 [Trichinella spiralis]